MRHIGEVVILAVSLGAVVVDNVKVVATVAEIEKVPCLLVAPVLGAVAGVVYKGMLVGGWRQELAGSACGERYLDAAQANVPVDVVLEDEGRLKARVEEPVKQVSTRFSELQTHAKAGTWRGRIRCLPPQGIVVP